MLSINMALTCDKRVSSPEIVLQKICDSVQDKDPIRAGFLHRLRTFNTINWVGKPINPPVLASHGWELAEENILRCSRCNQYLSTNLPFPGEAKAYKEACTRLNERLISAHSKFCIFNSDDHCNVVTLERISNKELISQIQDVVKNDIGECSFSFDKLEEVRKAFNLLKETHGLSDHNWSSFVLFLTGWSIIKDEDMSLGYFLECSFCSRKWLIEPHLVKEGSAKDIDQLFDPISQHQPWCAWRDEKQGWESRLEQCLMMMKNEKEGTPTRYLKRCASISEDMKRVRKMLKGSP